MKIVFWGTPEFAVPTLAALIAIPEFEVVAVVTQPDRRRGRGSELSPSPIKALALAHNLPVWQPDRVKKDLPTLELLRSVQADCFVVVAYGQLLSQEILDMPRYGCVNGHGSLLPEYRGAAPIQWCLYHGARETGMTTMLMDIGMDTGAMLLKSVLPIGPLDTAPDLAAKLSQQCADLMVQTLPGLVAGTLIPTPQDHTAASTAPLIQKGDYKLDWNKSAIDLHNQIRGFYPNCVTGFRGSVLKILNTLPQADLDLPGIPGTVIAIDKTAGIQVQTGAGLLLLTQVQPAGKRLQTSIDFANGLRLEVGECFNE
jgi:methionyl-tRNA formyltransferase